MIDKGVALNHYMRKDVQKEMILHSKDREVSVIFTDINGNSHFGKRPDTLKYTSDIADNVKNQASSFHVSVERWINPMRISTSLKRAELDELRYGWDLLFDIDIPDIELSKILAHLIIKSLKENGLKSISIKFSGNKGFHIGVPFEAFPSEVPIKTEAGIEVKNTKYFFPDGPLKISYYLIDYINKNIEKITNKRNESENIYFDTDIKYSKNELNEFFPGKTLFYHKCSKCDKTLKNVFEGRKIEYHCEACNNSIVEDYTLEKWNQEKLCEKCNIIMRKDWFWNSKCEHEPVFKFNLQTILEVDRQIFSSRHMYRMVYSLHEKSGLVSIPFNPSKVLKFDKKFAKPEVFKISKHRFMDISKANGEEGKELLLKAIEFEYQDKGKFVHEEEKKEAIFEDFIIKIPKELFPPCMINGLKGLDDGRKRFLFSLKNFLLYCNYPYDEIEQIILEWNKKNKEELKENIIIGQVRYSKQRKEKILPPNCFYKDDKKSGFYIDLGICDPDNFCPRIKNPFNYSKLKTIMMDEPKSIKKGKKVNNKDNIGKKD